MINIKINKIESKYDYYYYYCYHHYHYPHYCQQHPLLLLLLLLSSFFFIVSIKEVCVIITYNTKIDSFVIRNQLSENNVSIKKRRMSYIQSFNRTDFNVYTHSFIYMSACVYYTGLKNNKIHNMMYVWKKPFTMQHNIKLTNTHNTRTCTHTTHTHISRICHYTHMHIHTTHTHLTHKFI